MYSPASSKDTLLKKRTSSSLSVVLIPAVCGGSEGVKRWRERRKRRDIMSPKLLRGNTKYRVQERTGVQIWRQCCFSSADTNTWKTPKLHRHQAAKKACWFNLNPHTTWKLSHCETYPSYQSSLLRSENENVWHCSKKSFELTSSKNCCSNSFSWIQYNNLLYSGFLQETGTRVERFCNMLNYLENCFWYSYPNARCYPLFKKPYL